MKIPIGNALLKDFNYKNLFYQTNKTHNKIQNLNFTTVDKTRFPAVKLIPEMNRRKASAIIINASNEIFVDEFLKNNINFDAIIDNLQLVLRHKSYIKTSNLPTNSVKNIYNIDRWARETASKLLKKK